MIIFLRYITLFFLGECIALSLYAQSPEKYCNQVNALIQMLDKHHLRPVPPKDILKEETLRLFFQSIDPQQLMLSSADRVSLRPKPLRDGADAQQAICDVLQQTTALFFRRAKSADSLLLAWQHSPFDFTIAEDWVTYDKDRPQDFPETSFEQRWRQRIKYSALNLYVAQLDSTQLDSAATFDKVNFDKNIAQHIARACQRSHCRMSRRVSSYADCERLLAEKFLNILAQRYDPHSSFFSTEAKREFDVSLSKDTYSFGIEVSENDNGEIEIENVVPGGAAWKSNELHEGDILQGIQPQGKPPIDMACAQDDDLNALLYGAEIARIVLVVRKANGQVASVSLSSELVQTEENIVNGFLLQGKDTVGYIALPAFFLDFDTEGNAQGCANEVAKEIVKLQQMGMKGLILDLRNNGGGAIREALQLAGIFVDQGTLCIAQENGTLSLLKDPNRGTLYDAPLLIMVNGASASASELFAAMMRDHRRAIIVGTTTYGKASGQQVMPIDNFSGGYAKITKSQYFHANGKSHQARGITPDILLPDLYQPFYPREAEMPFVLPNDSVVKQVYFTPLSPLPTEKLRENSQKRLAADAQSAQSMRAFSKEIDSLVQAEHRISLLPEQFYLREKRLNKFSEKIGKFQETVMNSYEIANNRYTESVMEMDAYSREDNAARRNDLKTDRQLEEAFLIVSDMIHLQKP